MRERVIKLKALYKMGCVRKVNLFVSVSKKKNPRNKQEVQTIPERQNIHQLFILAFCISGQKEFVLFQYISAVYAHFCMYNPFKKDAET